MLSLSEFLELCRVYPVLSELPTNQQACILQETQVFRASVDTVLFDLESECRAFVMVLQGSIRVSYPTHRRELLLYHVLPGDSCIMTVSCLLGETVYQAHGVVEHDLVAATLPAAVFRDLILQSSDFRAFVFRFFSDRILQLVALIQEVAFERLDQRLARLLLAHDDRIVSTHQQLADDLGTVREVVSRYLKEFDARGLVRLGRREIYILDRPSLEALAQMQ